MNKDFDQRISNWARGLDTDLDQVPDLGLVYQPGQTSFRLYAPQAEKVGLLLYPPAPNCPQVSQAQYLNRARESSHYLTFCQDPSPDNYSHLLDQLIDFSELSGNLGQAQYIEMTRFEPGYWQVDLESELFGRAYLYCLDFPHQKGVISPDPYAKIITANGDYSVVGDALSLDLLPEAELASRPDQDRTAPKRTNPNYDFALSAIIYESQIRDFSIQPDQAFGHPGKFLGWAESGLTSPEGRPIGLDHVAQLGISHVQFLPLYNIASLDEKADSTYNSQYNWGYDPGHYFAVAGLFSSQPLDPFRRILELKYLSFCLNRQGLKIIMDVVFNHVYRLESHPLQLTNPGSCFRFTPDGHPHNGSFCGNETKSESPYFGRYILDCLTYWAKNFKLKGFRFDLMGLHDVVTMQTIRRQLDLVDPEIILLGEGWIMGNHPAEVQPANEQNAALMPGIAFFNDSFRQVLRGQARPGEGGLLTDQEREKAVWDLYNSICGGRFIKAFTSPVQNVLYLECHDNHTLRDCLELARPDLDRESLESRLALGLFLLSISHGICFIHSGQEFARTKFGIENSYNSPDQINALDWTQIDSWSSLTDKLRQLIKIRKKRPGLLISDQDLVAIRNQLIIADHGRLAYYSSHSGQELTIINFLDQAWTLEIPPGYQPVISSQISDQVPIESGQLNLPGTTGILLKKLN